MCQSGIFQFSTHFIKSKAYEDILSRSFDASDSEKVCIQAIAGNADPNAPAVEKAESDLYLIGVWNRANAWFISDLYFTYALNTVLRSRVIPKTDFKLDQPDSMEKVLLHALKNFQARDLLILNDPDQATPRIENGIACRLGNRFVEIPQLYVSPQTPVRQQDTKRGMSPAIDFYLNGRLNMYLELTRNGLKLQQHFDKFERQDGAYHRQKDQYVILDFQLKSDHPTAVPAEYKHCGDKLFCYVLNRNSLYRNGILVKANVSHNIASPI
jgi:hypothetical protein